MHLEQLMETVTLPDGVTAQAEGTVLTVKGPKGELARAVGSKLVVIRIEDGQIVFDVKNATRKEKCTLRTGKAHAKNMIRGVSEGHVYKLKICSGHFPMSVAIKGNKVEVKNFIGEKVPRTLAIKDGVSVKLDGEIITVEGVNKEITGNQAAAIELLTRRPGFDTRIFQDGIFLIEKDGKQV